MSYAKKKTRTKEHVYLHMIKVKTLNNVHIQEEKDKCYVKTAKNTKPKKIISKILPDTNKSQIHYQYRNNIPTEGCTKIQKPHGHTTKHKR